MYTLTLESSYTGEILESNLYRRRLNCFHNWFKAVLEKLNRGHNCSFVSLALFDANNLQIGFVMQTYQNVVDLRYGHVMIMADQDHDGSHIKGLVINFVHKFYPSLLKLRGFLQSFVTPIIKVILLVHMLSSFIKCLDMVLRRRKIVSSCKRFMVLILSTAVMHEGKKRRAG